MWSNGLLSDFKWCREISNCEEKRALGEKTALLARDGDVVGAGSGSSTYVALVCLAERVKAEGLSVTVIPAAHETRLACASLGLPVASILTARPDWCFDGADEIDENGWVIKGRGGALFGEKLIIASCGRRYLIADGSKFVPDIGAKFPIPVEVYPDSLMLAEELLRSAGAHEITLRNAEKKDGPVITEAGNLLLDCRFERITPTLERDIKAVPGVIESGLFQGYGFEYIK